MLWSFNKKRHEIPDKILWIRWTQTDLLGLAWWEFLEVRHLLEAPERWAQKTITHKEHFGQTESRTKSCAFNSPHSFLVMKMSMLSVGWRYIYEAVRQSYCNIEKCLEVALTEFALGLGHGPRPPGPLKTQKEMLVCV